MALHGVAFPVAPRPERRTGTRGWMNWPVPVGYEFVASRRSAGVRERTYLQATPMGELVIVTLEGDDPWGPSRR